MVKNTDYGKKEASRDVSFFNFWRKATQYAVTRFGYLPRFKIVYGLEVIGKENIPKDNKYVVASNHMSTLDSGLVACCLNRPLAYMAKKELFAHPVMRWWLNWLGAFAVDREKLGISTVKTALTITKTDWVLGIFPQGTRELPGEITIVNKGFAAIAKTAKCGILPVGIVGTDKPSWIPFSGKIIVKIGKLIPYSDNPNEMADKWIEEIQNLTGFTYNPQVKD